MTGPRRSTRLSGLSSSPRANRDVTSARAGSKRKVQDTDESPKPKHGRKAKAKKKQTPEESMPAAKHEDAVKDIETKEATEESPRSGEHADEKQASPRKDSLVKDLSIESEATEDKADKMSPKETGKGTRANQPTATSDEENADAGAEKADTNGPADKAPEAADAKHDKATAPETGTERENGPAIEKDPEREAKMPSNVVEKGIIYFFTRGRVDVEEPQGIQDLMRTYFVLRPLPKDAKLGQGPIPESDNNRLAVLPKKVLPKSNKDRFLAFVEKGGVSVEVLKEEFFPGAEYETKKVGSRQVPPVTPIGEGVYAITATGRTSHLAYILTIPREIDQVQLDIGLREKGSFIVSVKNPTKKGPTYAQLPQGPEYPIEILEEFGDLRWIPVHNSQYLNYANAQFLLIGEGEDRFSKALEPTDKDRQEGKETAEEELEKLEDEDQIHVEQMDGDAAVFQDLHIDRSEYPDVLTTW